MAHHAPAPIATHRPPLCSLPATSRAGMIPRWTELDAELRQALINLLTRMIGDSLPGPSARAGQGDADDPVKPRGAPARQDPRPPSGALGDRLRPPVSPPAD